MVIRCNNKKEVRSISKRLITKNNYETYLSKDKMALYLESDMILTPGAKDILRNLAVTIKYGKAPVSCSESTIGPENLEEPVAKLEDTREAELVRSIVRLLKDDFKIEEASKMTEILKRVLEKL